MRDLDKETVLDMSLNHQACQASSTQPSESPSGGLDLRRRSCPESRLLPVLYLLICCGFGDEKLSGRLREMLILRCLNEVHDCGGQLFSRRRCEVECVVRRFAMVEEVGY